MAFVFFTVILSNKQCLLTFFIFKVISSTLSAFMSLAAISTTHVVCCVSSAGPFKMSQLQTVLTQVRLLYRTCADPDWGTGGEISQKYRVFSKTGPDPMKITELPSQHSMFGRHRHASETPLKWRFAFGQ